jgi:hypothetical protein
MVKILSFDIGSKNLSYCLIDTKESKEGVEIVKWENIQLVADDRNANKIGVESMVETVLMALSERFGDTVVDVVLIENQPSLLNGLMKTVSVVVYTFFNMTKLMQGNVESVRFVAASSKLKCRRALELGPVPKTYKSRKAMSVEATRSYLCSSPSFSEMKLWFESQPKKDDLADAFLQAMYWAEMRVDETKNHSKTSV